MGWSGKGNKDTPLARSARSLLTQGHSMRLSYLSLLQPAVLCKAGDEEIGTNWMKLGKEKKAIKNLSAFLVKPQTSPAAAGAIVAAMCQHLTLGHGWPRGLSWRQQQLAGPHRPLETRDPLQRGPSCLLTLGPSAPDRRARRGMMFHATSEAAQQLASQTSTRREQFSDSSTLP